MTDFQPLRVMAGPCAVESLETTIAVAVEIKRVCDKLGLPFYFKASYRKANRTRLDSFTGIGDREALEVLSRVKSDLDVGIVTDIHTPEEAAMAADVADVIQIPAFLCRQTDLLIAAAQTGRIVNVKKGQFMAPDSMKYAVDKIRESGNDDVWLTERGTMHGYGDLVGPYKDGFLGFNKSSRSVVLCTRWEMKLLSEVLVARAWAL